MDHVQVFPDGELDVKERSSTGQGLTFDRQISRPGANTGRSSSRQLPHSHSENVRTSMAKGIDRGRCGIGLYNAVVSGLDLIHQRHLQSPAQTTAVTLSTD